MASSAQIKGVLRRNQITSRIADERLESHPSSKRQGKVKDGRNRHTGDEIQIRLNTLERNRRECVAQSSSKRDDELVRYMSNLPSYLRREEGGGSFQGKVLNVGVLDWGRLEKWKHVNKGDRVTTDGNNASSSGINISILDSSTKDDSSRDLKYSFQKSRRSWESELGSRDPLNKQKKAVCRHEASGSRVDTGKSRRTRSSQKRAPGLSSEMGSSGSSLAAKESTVTCSRDIQKKMERKNIPEANQKAPDPVIDSDIGASSVRSRKCSILPDLEEKRSGNDDGAKKRVKESQDSEACLASRQQRHKKHTGSAVFKPRMSLDDSMGEAKQSNFSADFADGTHRPSKLGSQIPRLYPLSLGFEKDAGSSISPVGVVLSSDACEKKRYGRKQLEAGCNSDVETSGRLHQEKSEEESEKSRYPSPVRRFSFSFSRLSRSFSFKEGSVAQPLSSDEGIKSGPVRFRGSACPDGPIQPEKLKNHNRARASPLKRLLDPLLKPKTTGNVPSSKVRATSSNPKPIYSDEPLEDERMQDMSTTRAFVQLTIRNGLTLFRFVVDDNSSSILMATLQTSTLSSKDNSVLYCTFYSVKEVKKKSRSWLIHGNKEKQCEFAYNAIGQMRLSNSLSSDLTEQSFRSQCPPVRESVLFEFEKRPDGETKKIKAGTELAAVVINRPSRNSSSKAPKNNSASMSENALEEDGDASGTTTVILPSGVHSFPNKGAPSPLIDRWRSGGLCDCGGWDIGCKLRVLSNQRCFHGFSSTAKAQSFGFQLFDQEGTQQNTPAITTTLLKTGIHSVEFSSSISPLQAFFVFVTIIICNSEQQPEDLEFNTPYEPGAPEDTMSKPDTNTKNRQTTLVRYSPFNPPLSPVGRV